MDYSIPFPFTVFVVHLRLPGAAKSYVLAVRIASGRVFGSRNGWLRC